MKLSFTPVALIVSTIGLAAVLAACSASGGANGTATPGVSALPTAATTAIQVKDFTILPATTSITASNVALAVTNDGPTIHNVTVRDSAGKVLFGSRDLRAGESQTITGQIAPGSYVLFCTLPGHESLGVKATLTVTAAP